MANYNFVDRIISKNCIELVLVQATKIKDDSAYFAFIMMTNTQFEKIELNKWKGCLNDIGEIIFSNAGIVPPQYIIEAVKLGFEKWLTNFSPELPPHLKMKQD